MAHDGPRRGYTGEIPEPPPGGTPSEIARAAWKMAWRAERLATNADNRSFDLFQQLGGLARTFTLEQSRRFDEVNAKLGHLNERFDDLAEKLKPQVEKAAKTAEEASEAAEEARTSSNDLSKEFDKMESILADMKTKTVDSVRVKQLVVEEHQVLVAKDRLAELEKRAADVETERRARAAEKRNYKLTTRGLIVSGIVLALFSTGLTYCLTRVESPATISSPSH